MEEKLAPVEAEYKPPGQIAHTDAPVIAWYNPAAQFKHDEAGTVEYIPELQAKHTDESVAPVDVAKVPAAQDKQVDAATEDWYLPAAHAVQIAAPAEYVPAMHAAQFITAPVTVE